MPISARTWQRDPEVAWVMDRIVELREQGTEAVMTLRSLGRRSYKIGVRYGTTCEEIEELRNPMTALIIVTRQLFPGRPFRRGAVERVHVLTPKSAP